MSSPTNIRKALSDDIEGIQQVYANSWAKAYAGVICEKTLERKTSDPSRFYPERKIQANLRDDESLYLVAVTDEKISGISHFCWGETNTHRFVEPGSAQLRAIYVEPASWGTGTGTALLEASLDRFPSTADTVMIECLAENKRARKFYESHGFELCDRSSVTLFDERLPTTRYRRPMQ